MSPDDWLLSLSELSGRNMEIWICSVTPHWRCAAILLGQLQTARMESAVRGPMLSNEEVRFILQCTLQDTYFFKLNDLLLRHC